MITRTDATQATVTRTLLYSVFLPVHISVNQVTRIRNIFSENIRLKREVAMLKTRVFQLEERAKENTRYRTLLNFQADFPFELISARIVAREPSAQFRSVIINSGRNDSLTSFMPVVSDQGLVGKLVHIMGSVSLVQLLSDETNRTSVRILPSRTVGILESKNSSKFSVPVRSHTSISVGDTIVTSGLGGIYPKGLFVGTVKKVSNSDDPLFKDAHVKVAVNFDKLEEVFVLRYEPQWQSFRQELDSLGVLK